MKILLIILIFTLQNTAQAQDSLLIEYVSTNSKIPFRNQLLSDMDRIKGVDTAKIVRIDDYISYIFLHIDSIKIKRVSYEELKKMKVLTKQQLSTHLDKISEKERKHQEQRIKTLKKQEYVTLPDSNPNKSEVLDKQEQYLKNKKLYLVIKDDKTQSAKIIPVRYIPEKRE